MTDPSTAASASPARDHLALALDVDDLVLAMRLGRQLQPTELAAAPITITLESTVGQGPPATISWRGTATQEVRVDRGAWQVLAEGPGFLPSRARFVAAGEAELAWEVVVTRRQVAVDLRFRPPRALRKARLSLRSDESGALIERELPGPTLTLMLAAGSWQLAVEAPRYRALPALTTSARASSVSSMGVSVSNRWIW